MKKIYVKGNYLIIEIDPDNQIINPKKEIIFNREPDTDTFIYKSGGYTRRFNYTEFSKEDGSSFGSLAEFETFIYENTGNFNGGGIAPEPTKNYKEVVGYVNQNGEDNPTLTILYSDVDLKLIETPELFARTNPGEYSLIFSEIIDLEKVFFQNSCYYIASVNSSFSYSDMFFVLDKQESTQNTLNFKNYPNALQGNASGDPITMQPVDMVVNAPFYLRIYE